MTTRRMTNGEGRRGNAQALCLVLLFASAQTLAQGITSDPTRPPSGAGTEASEAEAPADSGGGMTLQSVMISPTRKAAIINGQMVKLGDKYGDAVLVKVSENEVVLRSGGANQVLKLHPGIEKREHPAAGEKAAPRRGKVPG